MKVFTRPIFSLGALLLLPANAARVIPDTGGNAAGVRGGFENIGPFFGASPAAVPVVGTTANSLGGVSPLFPDAGREFYFGSGASFGNGIIEDVHVGFTNDGTNSSGVGITDIWSSDICLHFDPVSDDVPAPDFGIFSISEDLTLKSWQQSDSGAGAVQKQRLEEIAAVAMPPVLEPATGGLMALVLFGVLGCNLRR